MIESTKRPPMPKHVLTTVTATVDPEREVELVAGFRHLMLGPLPGGLLRTELLRGQNGIWRIQSLWHDLDALQAVRAGAEPPAALELFRRVGAKHSHEVFSVEESLAR